MDVRVRSITIRWMARKLAGKAGNQQHTKYTYIYLYIYELVGSETPLFPDPRKMRI